MPVEITERLLSNAAGWEAMKRARAYLEQEQVLSSFWEPPLLRGVVQSGDMTFRASIVIKGSVDMENLCNCREAREWGKICPHVVAVGLHWLKAQQAKSSGSQPAPRLGAGPKASSSSRPAGPRISRSPSGTPAELFLILPPNFIEAATRGKVMLVLEATTEGGRVPLNALPKEQSFAFADQDSRFIERLEELAGETPAMVILETGDFLKLLPLLAGHPRVTMAKKDDVTISMEPFPLPVEARLEPDGEITVRLRGALPPSGILAGQWSWQNRTLQPLGLAGPLAAVLQGPVRIPRSQVPIFLTQFWPQLKSGAGVHTNFAESDFVLEPKPPEFRLELKGGLAQLGALLQCAYGVRIMTLGVSSNEEVLWLPNPEVPTRYSTRDLPAERAALARLQRAGFSAPDAQGRMQLNGQDPVLNFFAREFPRLQREWHVTMEERLDRSVRTNLDRIEPRFHVMGSGIQWFDLGVVFASERGEKFSVAEIQRLVLGGQSHTRLKDGRIAIIDTGAVEELQEVLLDCSPQQHAEGYRMSATQAGFLDATLRQHPQWQVQAPPNWRERASRQRGEMKLECPALGPLESVLRPYQKQGVAWLHFLRENGFGGILADEMGLGKTLQALACLCTRGQETTGGRPGPALVVCPTSLVFNWLAEAARFAPALKVLAIQGPERHRMFGELETVDLVVTSYALVRRDAEHYAGREFDTIILDEAQHIKNRQTQNAQAVKSLRARHRLVLTGTPLENSVLDLWSIFDFLMPGYLGSARDFRERYEVPIVRERNPEAQSRLARRLRPFILRRTKREVAADLPEKLEQVAFCELNDEQQAVYQQVFNATRKEVLDAVGESSQARSRMVVLNALLRLRQVCCDLRLLKLEERAEGDGSAGNVSRSGKLELFSELLEEVIDGGHRVLVFSQFTSMLALLRRELESADVKYCYLDGSTTDRAAVVARFQNENVIPVFLISLKAGGVGLNLTGADTVIHFDPWWNPAVEAQATDRAHRIGQTRAVTSYKLIARGTVEEKILTLQQRKRELIAATIGDEQQFTEALTWEEIQELLT
jgi:superfamily II DNA or RNA helicase